MSQAKRPGFENSPKLWDHFSLIQYFLCTYYVPHDVLKRRDPFLQKCSLLGVTTKQAIVKLCDTGKYRVLLEYRGWDLGKEVFLEELRSRLTSYSGISSKKARKKNRQTPAKGRVCAEAYVARTWWKDGVSNCNHKWCGNQLFPAMDLGRGHCMPQLLVPLQLTFNPNPFFWLWSPHHPHGLNAPWSYLV